MKDHRKISTQPETGLRQPKQLVFRSVRKVMRNSDITCNPLLKGDPYVLKTPEGRMLVARPRRNPKTNPSSEKEPPGLMGNWVPKPRLSSDNSI